MLRKITCNRTRKLIAIKEKVSLYSSRNYIQLQSVVSTITSWKHTVQAVPLKKKKKKNSGRKKENEMEINKKKRRRRKGKRWKRREEEKGMERVCAEEKGKGRMRYGRKEERKEKEKKGVEEKEGHKMERTARGDTALSGRIP